METVASPISEFGENTKNGMASPPAEIFFVGCSVASRGHDPQECGGCSKVKRKTPDRRLADAYTDNTANMQSQLAAATTAAAAIIVV
jgi:hypothetical protein